MTTDPPLLARQRQDYVLAQVAAHGGVRVAEVVEALGVSEMTVRRDITELVSLGLVDRVHGGAVAAAGMGEPYFSDKKTQQTTAKSAIGTIAAARVRPGDSVALTGGTTTLAVARALTALPHVGTLTVATNSLPAAQILHEAGERARDAGRPSPTILLVGGERTRSDALVGPLAVEALSGLRFGWAFLGAHGFDPTVGLLTPNLAEAATNAAMVAGARTVVAVLDHTKWGVPALRAFCPTERLDVIVTDVAPDGQTQEIAEREGIVVEVAGSDGAPTSARPHTTANGPQTAGPHQTVDQPSEAPK